MRTTNIRLFLLLLALVSVGPAFGQGVPPQTIKQDGATSDQVMGWLGSSWGPVSISSAYLPTSGVTAGTYGDSTHVPQVTFDQYGRATGVTDVAISGGGGGSPVVTSTIGSGAPYTLTQSYANTGVAPVTLTSGDTYLIEAPTEIVDSTTNESLRLFLYDATAGYMIAGSEKRGTSEIVTGGPTTTSYAGNLIPSCIYVAPGNDTIQVWGCDVNSATDATITPWRSKINITQVSGSSSQSQQTLPSLVTSGLVGYWSADAITGVTSGSNLSTWTDSSGNGNTMTAGGTPPIYFTNAWNQLPGVEFNAAAAAMATSSLLSSSASVEIMLVLMPTGGTVGRSAFSDGSNGTNGFQIFTGQNGSTGTSYYVQGACSSGFFGPAFNTSGYSAHNQPILVDIEQSGTTMTLYINGVSENTSTGTPVTPTTSSSFGGTGSTTGGTFGSYWIFAAAQYSSALSSANRSQDDAFFMSKWDL